jgi:hypothetical protein
MNPTFKKYLVYAGVVLALLATAFVIGRYTAPAKIVEKVEVREVEKQVVVEKVDEKKLEELTLQVQQTLHQLSQLKKSIHKERTKVTHADGRTEEKEVVDVNVSRTVESVQVQEVEKQVVVVQEKAVEVEKQVVVEKVVEKEKIVTAEKPQWKVGPMVGVNLKELNVGQSLTTGPLSYGAHVERRIAGPVFVGAWGLSSGQAGVIVTVEF